MRNCCVLTCDNGYEFGEPVSYHRWVYHFKIHFHDVRVLFKNIYLIRFPLRNKPLLEKWIAAVSRESDWQPSKWTCICSAHFKTTDFIPHQRTPRLRDDAFPSIFTSTIRTQVKKKLAPDGRYDMEVSVTYWTFVGLLSFFTILSLRPPFVVLVLVEELWKLIAFYALYVYFSLFTVMCSNNFSFKRRGGGDTKRRVWKFRFFSDSNRICCIFGELNCSNLIYFRTEHN